MKNKQKKKRPGMRNLKIKGKLRYVELLEGQKSKNE